MSINLVKQNILVPKEESSSDNDMEFHESQQNQKKNWWRKWRLFGGGCCHASIEASQQVPAEQAPPATGKPSFPTRRVFFLGLSRSSHRPSYLPNQEWESSHRMVIKGSMWLSVKAKRNNEIRMDFFCYPKYGISWEFVWNAESEALPRCPESESAF